MQAGLGVNEYVATTCTHNTRMLTHVGWKITHDSVTTFSSGHVMLSFT